MITIEIKNDQITAALARISAALADQTPVMQDFGEYLIKSTKERFSAGTAPDGSVWAAKSPVTIARYPGSTKPLIGESKSLSSQIFYEAFPDRVEWGSPMIYAAMQQFGGSKSAFPNLWGDIPARPFLGLSEEDEVNLVEIAGEWLESAAAGGA